jgi:hypothetical protein
MRRVMTVGIAATSLLGLVACSADEQDFKEEAEKYIESDDVATAAGLAFENAVCEQPTSKDIGTEYSCTADGEDGVSYVFTVQINAENSLLVTDYQPADG